MSTARYFLLAATAFTMPVGLRVEADDDWKHYAGNERRDSIATAALQDLSTTLWVTGQYPMGTTIRFEGPSSPVVYGGRVYASAKHFAGSVHQNNKLMAFEIETGAVVFETLTDRSVLDSWSSPAVDEAHNAVLLGTGSTLYSINAANGAIQWETPLAGPVVNASPLVMADVAGGRAFITQYDGFGGGGVLHCINTSAFEALANPYQPGDIVWQETIGGSSGNTPAHHDGVVYVSSITGETPGCEDRGHIHAFDIDAAPGLRRLWSNCVEEGFFGGVCYANGFVYAASYDLFGSGDNSTLVKLNTADGSVVWTTPCERTNSIPVVAGDRIYLSAGLAGFGSTPKVQAFRDDGTSAVKLWDTHVDTAGAMVVGGWTHQPVWSGGVLYVGKIAASGGFYAPYTDLFLLDVSLTPNDAGFVVDHHLGMGSSPAVCKGRLYTIGAAGLHAVAKKGDFSGDGRLDGRDVQGFVDALTSGETTPVEVGLGDFSGDGMLGVADIEGFTGALVLS